MKVLQGYNLGRSSLGNEHLKIEKMIEANTVLVTCLYDAITRCTISLDFLEEIKDNDYNFRMPDIRCKINEFYLSDSDHFKEEEHTEVHMAISAGLENILSQGFRRKKYGTMPLANNLFHYIQYAYPDPNELIRQYEGFSNLQEEGLDEKAGVSWLLHMMHTSDLYGLKMKIEDSIRLHKLMKEYGEFALARKIELFAEEELNS